LSCTLDSEIKVEFTESTIHISNNRNAYVWRSVGNLTPWRGDKAHLAKKIVKNNKRFQWQEIDLV